MNEIPAQGHRIFRREFLMFGFRGGAPVRFGCYRVGL
jgi:hypothetical protein